MIKPNELYPVFCRYDEKLLRHVEDLPGEWKLTGRWKMSWVNVESEDCRQDMWVEVSKKDVTHWFHESMVSIGRMDYVYPDDYVQENYETAISKEQRKEATEPFQGQHSRSFPSPY